MSSAMSALSFEGPGLRLCSRLAVGALVWPNYHTYMMTI